MAFPSLGLAALGSAVLATLVVSSVWTVYLMLPESGSCQTEAAEPSASKPTSPKLLQETQKLAAAKFVIVNMTLERQSEQQRFQNVCAMMHVQQSYIWQSHKTCCKWYLIEKVCINTIAHLILTEDLKLCLNGSSYATL